MTINQEFLNKFMELKRETNEMQSILDEKSKHVLQQLKEIYEELECVDEDDEYSPRNIRFDRILYASMNGEEVSVKTEIVRYCSCCQNETYYYDFPVHYLFDNNWQNALREEILNEKEETEQLEWAEKKKQEEESKRIQEEREKKEWERLSEKYGKKEENSK